MCGISKRLGNWRETSQLLCTSTGYKTLKSHFFKMKNFITMNYYRGHSQWLHFFRKFRTFFFINHFCHWKPCCPYTSCVRAILVLTAAIQVWSVSSWNVLRWKFEPFFFRNVVFKGRENWARGTRKTQQPHRLSYLIEQRQSVRKIDTGNCCV